MLVISEIQIKISVRYHYALRRVGLIISRTEPSHIAGGK